MKLKTAANSELESETAEPAVENSTVTSADALQSPPSPEIAPAPEAETKAKVSRQGKVTKRGNPDYMQAIFHLPVKTSKRLDRELLDLGEAGEDLDRSEFAEEIFQSFFRLSKQVGAAEALKQFRSLGIE